MDENDLIDKLSGLESASEGAYRWSETAGLKQLIRDGVVYEESATELLTRDYASKHKRSAA